MSVVSEESQTEIVNLGVYVVSSASCESICSKVDVGRCIIVIVIVSSVGGAPRKCGVLAASGGIAGIG